MPNTTNSPLKTYSASLLSAVEAVYGCKLSSVGERMQSSVCSPSIPRAVVSAGATDLTTMVTLEALAG